jgi:hypothetical protein
LEVLGVDHLAICVASLEEGTRQMEELGARVVGEHVYEAGNLVTRYFLWGEMLISLEYPTGPNDFQKFLDRRGDGVHHVGISVRGLEAWKTAAEARGVRLPNQYFEGDVRHETLVHPKSGAGTLWQLVEWKGDYAIDPSRRLQALLDNMVFVPGVSGKEH